MTAACAYPCWRLLRITVRQSVNGILVNEWSGFCQDKEAYEVLNEEGAFTAISQIFLVEYITYFDHTHPPLPSSSSTDPSHQESGWKFNKRSILKIPKCGSGKLKGEQLKQNGGVQKLCRNLGGGKKKKALDSNYVAKQVCGLQLSHSRSNQSHPAAL